MLKEGTQVIDKHLSSLDVAWNLSVPRLVEQAIARGEGQLTATGAFATTTGKFTGRSPKDKYIVDEPSVHSAIDWGPVNQPISESQFDQIYERLLRYMKGRQWFGLNAFAGADPAYRLPIRVLTEYAWHQLFARQLLINATDDNLDSFREPFTVVDAPGFYADPERDDIRSGTFIIIHFAKRLILIGGTEYAGEIKKSVFSLMNYLLPDQNVLPMHCSANMDSSGRTALFFGLSGTGKTTLSADPNRRLIGDDEHGWSDRGIFNMEGGCYAKCINLSREKEPQIYNAIRFGSVLENVIIDRETGVPVYDDSSLTENTRAAYPIEYIEQAVIPGIGRHPEVIVFLTADAFGVLPPIARLSTDQAMYYFLSGYTSKLAGTERGVTQPEATFSTCFGAPFLPRPAQEYAQLLGERIAQHGTQVYLVNTGWTGGPYGTGERMKLAYTRAMVRAAIDGALEDVPFEREPYFHLSIPSHCPDVPSDVLNPKHTWSDPEAYERKARELAARFHDNFQRFSYVAEKIRKAGPPVRG
ncbi:MAG: phosphoenolpyruvate carboxykinase (ATP) [Novibacillus thermophilus]